MHKVVTKNECFIDIAKETEDRKVARCSSCQIPQIVKQVNWRAPSTCQDGIRLVFSQGTD
ncbi:unnamed protein product, partial [Bubo scandiacus]